MNVSKALVISTLMIGVSCQDTGQTVVASHLRECYSNPELLDRNHLAPMTLPVLLEIIRKIEDYPGTIASMRQLTIGILHMFRQDGIIFDPGSQSSPNILPYSPTGFQAYKSRLLLNKLLPNNQFRFPEASLTIKDKCALHRMISSTISMETRGDENTVCPQKTQTRKRRSERHTHADVEVFDVKGAIDPMGRQIIGVSTCPLEGGVMATRWGAVAVGPLIAGIASALEPQQVLVTDLVRVKSDFDIKETTRVNNVHSSTIAGDLAEVAMRQGTNGQNIALGAVGFWNSTNVQRHYFLRKTNDLEITDAEIRGGIDGLILGDLGSSYEKDHFSELKLSQLLEMYYSEKGTMHDPRFRACLRRSLITQIASTDTLKQETFGFSIALYTTMPLYSTLTLNGVERFVNTTVDNFYSYVAQSLNDPTCSTNNEQIVRPRINLILVCAPTAARYPLISYILDEIDISTRGSSVVLMNPQNGDTLIDKTFSLSQFHQQFSKIASTFSSGPSINLTRVFQSLRSMASANLITDTAAHYIGGNSTIVLFLVENIPLTTDELQDSTFLAVLMRQQTPDLRLVFATTPAAEDSLVYIIRDNSDFIPITLSAISPSAQELAPVSMRLRNIPRRVINPLCGTHWINSNSGTVSFEEFADADGMNLYSIHPNYFYGQNSARAVRIHNALYGTVDVCYSRSDPFPVRDRTSSSTPPDVTCESVTSTSSVEMSLAGACDGFTSIAECPPLYFTVSSTTSGGKLECRDFGCRLPNDLKYTVTVEQLGCYSGVAKAAPRYECILVTLLLSMNYLV